MACLAESTLADLAAGRLAGEAKAQLEEHVAACTHCAAAVAAQKTPPVARFPDGAVLAERYRIVRFIARGGMGEVYEAEDVELRTRIALKTIRAEIADDPRAVDRFKREINLARRVTHPNVCRIFDVGFFRADDTDAQSPRVPFLTMEFLEGETLADWLRGVVRLRPEEALPLVGQLTAALQASHDAGVVHRDFKSANVLLVGQGDSPSLLRAVVTDFGVARSSDGGERVATATTASSSARGLVGSPGYMSPEQVEGREASAAADQYALGVVLYEMVTGHLPFEAPTPMLTALRRLEHPPTPPRTYVADLDERWERVITRCLERSPERRFPSVRAVHEALGGTATAVSFTAPRRAGETQPRRSRPADWPTPTLPASAAAAELVTGREPRRRPLWPWPAATLAVLALAAVLWRPIASAPRPAATPPPAPTTPTVSVAPPTATTLPAPAPALPVVTPVVVRSDPPGATILVDDRPVGTTPAVVSVTLPHEVRLTLAGYRLAQEVLTAPGEITVRLVKRRPSDPRPAADPGKRLLDE